MIRPSLTSGRWTDADEWVVAGSGGGASSVMMSGYGAGALNLDELVQHWTLLDDERELFVGKRGLTRLGVALLLKFYTLVGRFLAAVANCRTSGRVRRPAGRGRAVGLGQYQWTGSTIAYHRAQIRSHLDFRECSVLDAEKLTQWLRDVS